MWDKRVLTPPLHVVSAVKHHFFIQIPVTRNRSKLLLLLPEVMVQQKIKNRLFSKALLFWNNRVAKSILLPDLANNAAET